MAAENLSKSQYHSEWSDADGNRKKEKPVTVPSLPDFPGTTDTPASEPSTTFEVQVDAMLGQPFFQLVTDSAPSSGNTFDIAEPAVGFSNNSNTGTFKGYYLH